MSPVTLQLPLSALQWEGEKKKKGVDPIQRENNVHVSG